MHGVKGLTAPIQLVALAVFAAAAVGVYAHMAAYAQEPADQAAAPRPPRPILDAHHLMELFSRPVYEYLKKSVAEPPSAEKGWEEIANRGLQVAEVANLIALRDREESQEKWISLAAELQQAGVELSDVAKQKNWQATRTAYESVIAACNNCHQTMAPSAAPRLEP